ncbi:hypothetical protein [Ideonella sp. BN130291]|uniref:hypothetical protein n=1 Tax=Ideonella sp. BN130291 TaxID=3112940 RepID=UPI002E264B5B|nr:hypothetical protein [Ideonella sp. BN130291]
MKRLLVCALVLLPAMAPAQTVYRCGPEGNQYSSEPCPAGRPVDVDDQRTNAQRQAAQAAAKREAALARRLAQERERREAAVQPAVAVGIRGERGVPAARSASAPAASKSKKKKSKKSPSHAPDAPVTVR